MYGLGKLSDYLETDGGVVYLTPQKRSEVWLCDPLTPVAKAIDADGFLWGMVFEFVDRDNKKITVVANRKMVNKSGRTLAKGFSKYGLNIYPGYEQQFSAYLSAKLELVKSKKTLTQVPSVHRLET